MKEKRVSVAMATYNGERFLRQQLDSIYGQTYKNIEVVVTDDCSKDGTIKVLEEYKRRYGLKYYVNRINLGYVKNFQRAMSLCEGDYIALADQDDIWVPQKIEVLLKWIGSHSLVCSDAALIDEEGRTLVDSLHQYSGVTVINGNPFELLIFKNFVTGCTALFNREILKKALPIPEGEKYHDWWLAIVASKMCGIKYIQEPLVLYRQHGCNSIGAYHDESLAEKVYKRLVHFKEERMGKSQYAEVQLNRLYAMLELPLFNDGDKKVIQDAIAFYSDYMQGPVHCKTTVIAAKYQNVLYANRLWHRKLLALAGTLVG